MERFSKEDREALEREMGLELASMPVAVRTRIIKLTSIITTELIEAVINAPDDQQLRWEQAVFSAGLAVNNLTGVLRLRAAKLGESAPTKQEYLMGVADAIGIAMLAPVAFVEVDQPPPAAGPNTRH